MLFTDIHHAPLTIPLCILNTSCVYITSVAGGIFAPSFALGSGIDLHIGQILENVIDIFTNSNLFTLCGMVAFLTGVTKTPLTAFTSILVARILNKAGLYELALNDYLKMIKEISDEHLVAKPEWEGN